MNNRAANFKRLWGFSVGFYGVWIAHVGRRTGLLAHIAKNPMTVDELTSSTGLHFAAVRAWCMAALSYRLLVRTNSGKLRLPSSVARVLVQQDHPHYLGGQFSYLAMRSLEYGGFDELFKRGETRPLLSSFDAIEEATHWDHYAFLASVRHKKRLHSALSKGCSVIDIGCGSGSLIAKLQGVYPRSSYVGIDPSDVAVAKARQLLQGKSSEILRMKAEDMDFSARFDLAYLGESLYAAKDKQQVILNCHSALKRGGTIAIVEGILPTSRMSSDENRLIMAMQLDFALQGCEFLSRGQLLLLLRTANFVDILFDPLGGSVYLVTARKR